VIRSNILLQKVQVLPSAPLSILLHWHHSQHCPALYFLRISHHLPVSRKDGTLWLSASMFCGSGAICLLALKFLLYLSSRWLTAFFSRFYETLLYNDRRALRNPYIGPSSHMPVKQHDLTGIGKFFRCKHRMIWILSDTHLDVFRLGKSA